MSNKVKEEGISVVPYLQEINVYESIFDNTISGTVTLVEDIGLIELVPIIGVEYLWLAFEVDDSTNGEKVHKFERMFRVVKVRDVSYPRHDHRVFTLELSTHEFVASIAQRISRQYDKTVREAVEDILKKDLGVSGKRLLTVEDTYGKIRITIPNYTPLQAINFLTLLGQTKDQKESNFVFFETLKGFHFTSVSKLITDGLKEAGNTVYRVNPGDVTGNADTTDNIVRNSIQRLFQEQTVDTLVDISGGMLRSRMIHFDFLARQLKHTDDSRYSETFKKTQHLADNPVYPENFDKGVGKNVRTFTFPTNVWSKDGKWMKQDSETPEQRLYEAIVLHNRQMKEITHVQTLIEMPGHPEIHAGSVMNIAYPATRAIAGKSGSKTESIAEKDTPLFTGPHLVTAVRHCLMPQGAGTLEYTMHLKVCKDSFRQTVGKFADGETYE
jgi:hypothetical protein